MLFIVLASALPLFFGYLSRDRFDRAFTTLAVLFSVAFYCLPLFAAYSSGRIVYVGHSNIFTSTNLTQGVVGMLVFASGFAALSLYLTRNRRSAAPPPRVRRGFSDKVLQGAFAMAIVVMIVVLYRADFYQTNVAVRAKDMKISYVLAASMMALYFIGCYYLILSLNRKSIVLSIFWFVSTLSLILIYGGRVQTLVVLALPFVRFVKRLNLALVLMCVAIVLLFPLIIGGKSLLAAIGGDGNVIQTVIDLYRDPVANQSLLDNFSHPFASYYYAPSLVQDIGYRWFWDIPQGLLFYLRLIGIDAGQSLTYFNTRMLLGIDESVIPPGYLAFGYVQANLLGVFLMGVFFRFTGSFARYVKERCLIPSETSDFFFAFMAANTFYIGETRGLILTFFVPCLLMYAIGGRRAGQHRRPAYRASLA